MNLSREKLATAVSLREQIDALERRLQAIFSSPAKRSRKTMSAAARAKLAAAAKARWAKRRATASSGPSQGKRRSALTAAGKKKFSDAMKARWARRESEEDDDEETDNKGTKHH